MTLIKNGRNITSTHAMFRLYTKEMCEEIKKQGYTLFIDESVEVFTEVEFSIGDINVLVDGEYVKFEEGVYRPTGKQYDGTRMRDIFKMLKSNELIPIKKELYYWALPKDVIMSFKDVYILTYMFDCQDLCYYLQMHNIEFTYLGVKKMSDGVYSFTDDVNTMPEYVSEMSKLIHIIDNENINKIGDRFHSLSVNWYRRNSNSSVVTLKNHIYNYMHNLNQKVSASKKMWSTYKSNRHFMRGKGYSSGYTVFNQKATNDLKNKNVLAYLVNLFVTPEKIKYFSKNGIVYNQDRYALSVMLQWIWRSAIREGKEIWLYIPSSRMRDLLIDWMNTLNKGDK
jgi:hypothetical protein